LLRIIIILCFFSYGRGDFSHLFLFVHKVFFHRIEGAVFPSVRGHALKRLHELSLDLGIDLSLSEERAKEVFLGGLTVGDGPRRFGSCCDLLEEVDRGKVALGLEIVDCLVQTEGIVIG
jgi:hypothetical protein